jgi:drug/metabolite transporter (DMT)-like permease
VLVTASPIFVAIASYLLFREKLTARIIIGIIVSVAGAIVIGYNSWQTSVNSLLGGALSLGGALAVSGYLLIGRRLRQTMGLLSYVFLTYLSASVFLLMAVLLSGQSLFSYTGNTYLMLVLLALVPQLMGHTSLNWVLKYLPATIVTVAVLGEPVGATFLAWLILREAPALIEIIGGVLILGGIVIAFSKSQLTEMKQRG